MGGHHIGFQILGQIQNALGTLNGIRIQLGIAETAAQVAAQGGNGQTAVLDHFQEFLALVAYQIFRGQLTECGVYLDALGADIDRFFQRGGDVGTEGIQHDADGKIVHDTTSFLSVIASATCLGFGFIIK